MKILEEAVGPFYRDRQFPRKIIIGIILSVIPVGSFICLGYIIANLKNRLEGNNTGTLPEWKNIDELFILGVLFFLVILAYFSIPMFFTTVSFYMLEMGFVFIPLAIISLMASAALWLGALYMMPMAVAFFLRKNSVSAFFKFSEIYNLSLTAINNYLRATILGIFLIALISMPVFLSPVGYLLTLPIAFVVLVYLSSVYGGICLEVFSRT